MRSIAGFCDFTADYSRQREMRKGELRLMNRAQQRKATEGEEAYLSAHCGLSRAGRSVMEQEGLPETGCVERGGCVLAYSGELYNGAELADELVLEGACLENGSDEEIILEGFLRYGCDYMRRLNGVYSMAVWEKREERLYLFRDKIGVKSLFYTKAGDRLVFSSQIKGILALPGMERQIDREGLCEVFGLGPARTMGKGVFAGICEVKAGEFLRFDRAGLTEQAYWQLESRPHEDSFEETVEKTHFLVTDAVRRQMKAAAPVCAFLSGGVDSSLVTAICCEELKKQGKRLDTYSFDFKDNQKHFKANDFQPSQDRPWVDKMVRFADTDHHYLECDHVKLYEYLYRAVDARDLPCMADVESSMLYFCSLTAREHKVALTGECADEIFGGYPWFHKKECLEAECFPWSMDFSPRTMLLKDEVLCELPLREYARAAYERTVRQTPALAGESVREKRRREIAFLNLKWFMQTLLDRMDRTSVYAGLTARVPFADYRLVEYVFNVPWSMKYRDGVVKALLRIAGERHLPYEVLYRRKSPYPKTYDPAYERLVKEALSEVMEDTGAPINQLIDKKKLEAFMKCPADYGRPFYGQLMAGPQLLAYLLQVNYWLKTYGISLRL